MAAVSVLHALISGDNISPSPHSGLISLIQDNPGLKARLYLAGLLFPYLGITYRDAKGKTQSTVTTVIRESLKLGTQNHYLDGIPALFTGIPILKSGMEKHQHMGRAQLGLLLRNKFIHNPMIGVHWSTSIFFSLVTELVPCYCIKDDKFDREFHYKISFFSYNLYQPEDISVITTRYNAFMERIVALGLQNDVDSKTILSVGAFHYTPILLLMQFAFRVMTLLSPSELGRQGHG